MAIPTNRTDTNVNQPKGKVQPQPIQGRNEGEADVDADRSSDSPTATDRSNRKGSQVYETASDVDRTEGFDRSSVEAESDRDLNAGEASLGDLGAEDDDLDESEDLRASTKSSRSPSMPNKDMSN